MAERTTETPETPREPEKPDSAPLEGEVLAPDTESPAQAEGVDEEAAAAAADSGAHRSTEAPPPAEDEPPQPAAPPRKGGGFGVIAGTIVAVVLIIAAAAASWPYWAPRLAGLIPTSAETGGGGRLAALEERLAKAESALAGTGGSDGGQQAVAAELAALSASREALAEEMRATAARMAEMEKSLQVLRDTATGGGAAGADMAAIEQRLADLEQAGAPVAAIQARLDDLAARLAEQQSRTAAIDELSRRNQELADKVSDLTGRVAAVESARAQAGAAVGVRADLLVAVAGLRRALNGPAPFEDALDAVVQVAGGDAEVEAAVAPLRPRAAQGIPTRDQLRSRFSGVAREMVRADDAAGGEGWLDNTVDRLKGLVTVRRVGGGPSGTDVDAAVSHAETALAAGELEAAVGALDDLSGPAADAAAGWLDDARARLAAEAALAALDLRAATLPADGGGG